MICSADHSGDQRSVMPLNCEPFGVFAKYPSHDIKNKPWSINQVQGVTEHHYKRNTYSDKLHHLPALGIRQRCEYYDDKDSDESHDSDDDFEEYQEFQRTLKENITLLKDYHLFL